MASKRKAVACVACNSAPATVFCQKNAHCRKKRGVCSIECAQQHLVPSQVTASEFLCSYHIQLDRTVVESFLPTVYLAENACSLCKEDCVPSATTLCNTCSARVCHKWRCSGIAKIMCSPCADKVADVARERLRGVRTSILGFADVLGKRDYNSIVATFNMFAGGEMEIPALL